MAFSSSRLIEIRRVAGKGRGVFAAADIKKGTVIERAPVLVLPIDEVCHPSGRTRLEGYCFCWGRGTVALPLGYGALYNHSYVPNARYDDRARAGAKIFTALRDIAKGEEITVSYNGDPDDPSPVSFPVIE
jgi:SET domain-containing protein